MEQKEIDALLATLQSKHGKHLAWYADDQFVFVAKRPPRKDYLKFKADVGDEAKRIYATEDLCRACLVHPDAQAFDAALEEIPGIADKLGEQLVLLAVGGEQARVGKK
jgi:hypothetical protein